MLFLLFPPVPFTLTRARRYYDGGTGSKKVGGTGKEGGPKSKIRSGLVWYHLTDTGSWWAMDLRLVKSAHLVPFFLDSDDHDLEQLKEPTNEQNVFNLFMEVYRAEANYRDDYLEINAFEGPISLSRGTVDKTRRATRIAA
ncbi:hypothetical protein V8F20_011842 [Naviculisporaceae sp. PSN 640]